MNTRLTVRFRALGYSVEQLHQALRYLRDDAPIVIHFDCNQLLPKLVGGETHYRNRFHPIEGGPTFAPQRYDAENRLFSGIYNHVPDDERPCYGAFNILNDPQGVAACRMYGGAFMTLRGVRLRSTFSDQVSVSPLCRVGTCQYYGHILERFTDQELRELIAVASGAAHVGIDTASSFTYREVQIHGEILLGSHVESLHIPQADFENFCDMLEQIRLLHGMEIVVIEPPVFKFGHLPQHTKPAAGRRRGGRRQQPAVPVPVPFPSAPIDPVTGLDEEARALALALEASLRDANR
jgi:hypothetical protein